MAAALPPNRFSCTSLDFLDSTQDVMEMLLTFLLCCTLGFSAGEGLYDAKDTRHPPLAFSKHWQNLFPVTVILKTPFQAKITNAMKYGILWLEYLIFYAFVSCFLRLVAVPVCIGLWVTVGASDLWNTATWKKTACNVEGVLPQLKSILVLCGNVCIFIHIKAQVLVVERDCLSVFSLAVMKYLFWSKFKHVKSTDCKYIKTLCFLKLMCKGVLVARSFCMRVYFQAK